MPCTQKLFSSEKTFASAIVRPATFKLLGSWAVSSTLRLNALRRSSYAALSSPARQSVRPLPPVTCRQRRGFLEGHSLLQARFAPAPAPAAVSCFPRSISPQNRNCFPRAAFTPPKQSCAGAVIVRPRILVFVPRLTAQGYPSKAISLIFLRRLPQALWKCASGIAYEASKNSQGRKPSAAKFSATSQPRAHSSLASPPPAESHNRSASI